ncbi:hypothetical protein FALBO_11030 [Fusarium albosuccineum]|uniref:Uncharacterized protein n=1 Tax=Fusarium albosuccineum TaxID=1237068 RepID=A0A8H4P7J8_9HYPO|nr:hypothetical protein FALBO_11030 [Fusarium albosuccineum]
MLAVQYSPLRLNFFFSFSVQQALRRAAAHRPQILNKSTIPPCLLPLGRPSSPLPGAASASQDQTAPSGTRQDKVPACALFPCTCLACTLPRPVSYPVDLNSIGCTDTDAYDLSPLWVLPPLPALPSKPTRPEQGPDSPNPTTPGTAPR